MLAEIGDAHRAAALFVLGLADHEAREDLAVQAAHRGRGQHAFGRAADAHDGVHAAADDSRGNARREIAVGNQADARASRTDLLDQLLVARTVEHGDDEVLDVALEAARDRLQVLGDRRVQADRMLGARSDDQLFHVEIGRVEQAAAVRCREHGDRVGRAGGTQVRALERIDRDVDLGEVDTLVAILGCQAYPSRR